VNIHTSFFLSLLLNLSVSVILTLFLRSALRGVLLDLCGTEERAHFWMRFATIMLVAMPLVIALAYRPGAEVDLFFGIAGELGKGLLMYLFTLAITGGFISVFALFSSVRANADK
jgi:hypothetical protein